MTQYVTEMNAQGHYIGPYPNLEWKVYIFNTGVIIFVMNQGVVFLPKFSVFFHNTSVSVL